MSHPMTSHQWAGKPVQVATYGPRREHVLDIAIGKNETRLGVLHHFRDGPSECSRFTFDRSWLNSPLYFAVSPELRRHVQGQWRKPPARRGSPFFSALADVQPDGFARKVLDDTLCSPGSGREASDEDSRELAHLCAIHDICRLGALRVRPLHVGMVTITKPIMLPTRGDLDSMLAATVAFERGDADLRQRHLLLYCASALGGSRPKISFFQEDGSLALAKLPSVFDEYPVTKAEMLGYELAKAAGITVAQAQLKNLRTSPALIVQRFDRGEGGGRKHYLSAQSLLLAEESELVSCLDLINCMRARCKNFAADARELWRRMMFKLLINSPEAQLRKIGFLYAGHDRWGLAPAIDMTPGVKPGLPARPAQIAELGPQCDVQSLLDLSEIFALPRSESLDILTTLVEAISRWKTLASQFGVGMKRDEIDKLESVMNNVYFRQALEIVGPERARA